MNHLMEQNALSNVDWGCTKYELLEQMKYTIVTTKALHYLATSYYY